LRSGALQPYIFERIIYVLKHMDILQRMPFLAQDAVFRRLSEIAEVASLSKEDRRKYDESLKQYRDTIAVMHGQFLEGEAKGRAEGEAKGRAEGEAKGREEVARQLKLMGLPINDIVKATSLTEEEVERL
jgi:predicted transposase/invertase (TIGR01784 family)